MFDFIMRSVSQNMHFLNIAAWVEFGTTENGCWWLAYEACKNVSKNETTNCVSDKQLRYDNFCSKGKN